jgi:hypothetical protein
MRLPAPSRRVRAAWAISWPKSNCMSMPALGLPQQRSLTKQDSGRYTLPSRQASPSSSGVTATGEAADAGFDWKKPKPLASSTGIRLRSDTSFTSSNR